MFQSRFGGTDLVGRGKDFQKWKQSLAFIKQENGHRYRYTS